MKTKLTFEEYLKKDNLSKNTITSYLWTVNYYTENYDAVSKENLLAYKGYLMEFFKPKTVNLRIQAINKYLEYLDKQQLQLKAVKVQQKNFLENVISNADYNFLKKQLKKDGNMEWYFVIWYLAATGARVSELIQIKYGLDKKVVYPHSFRHRYAKNFLEKYNDIALLADLMGHESIETTRIYLRRTASEQQELVDKIVTW